MGWESSGVVRFDLGPLLQGQTRIAKLKSSVLNSPFLVGPGRYRFQRAGTRVLVSMGDNS